MRTVLANLWNLGHGYLMMNFVFIVKQLDGREEGAFFCYEFNRICCYCLDGGTDRILMAKIDKRYLGSVRSK